MPALSRACYAARAVANSLKAPLLVQAAEFARATRLAALPSWWPFDRNQAEGAYFLRGPWPAR